jgi:hypothetical protein
VYIEKPADEVKFLNEMEHMRLRDLIILGKYWLIQNKIYQENYILEKYIFHCIKPFHISNFINMNKEFLPYQLEFFYKKFKNLTSIYPLILIYLNNQRNLEDNVSLILKRKIDLQMNNVKIIRDVFESTTMPNNKYRSFGGQC